MKAFRTGLISSIALLIALILTSCGGSGNSDAAPAQDQGRVRITIKWPKRDRTIPQATNSITITAVELIPNEDGDGFTEDEQLNLKLVPRPEGDDAISVTVLDLPAIRVRLRAKAFENGLGTGPAIAAGSTDVTVQGAGSTVSANITLDVAVTQITVEPASLTMAPDGDEVLVATAKDADGNTILVDSDDLLWSSTDTSVAIVSQRAAPNGDTADVSALQGGAATIRVTHTPTGVFKDVLVSVPAGVTVSPASATIQPGTTRQFTASAVGNPAAQFTWTVSGGGTINPTTGLFTAAANGNGAFIVRATVVGDASKVGSANIRVGLPFLFSLTYQGTGDHEGDSLVFKFVNGEVNGELVREGEAPLLIPVGTMDEDSYSHTSQSGENTFFSNGQVSVAGITASISSSFGVRFPGGGESVITFTGQNNNAIPPSGVQK